jgi:hypothetical protein
VASYLSFRAAGPRRKRTAGWMVSHFPFRATACGYSIQDGTNSNKDYKKDDGFLLSYSCRAVNHEPNKNDVFLLA